MSKITKRVLMIAMIFVLLVSISACSANNAAYNSGGGSMADVAAEAPQAAPAPAAAEEYYADAEMDYQEVSEEVGFDTGGGTVQDGRKLTFYATITINTKNFNVDYRSITSLISQSGGYIASENFSDYTSYGRNEGRSTWMSVRVPADGYNSFLDGLAGIGETTDLSRGSDDLTSQYFDTEARIEMLELRKERLMKYLVEAEDAADIVEFERELSNVLYELDQYQGNKRHLDQLVDYASVEISLTELITPETIGKDGEPLGDRASSAFGLSLDSVSRFLQDAVVFLAAAAPVIALLAVIALIVWLIFRLTRRAREKARVRREERQVKREAELAQRRTTAYYQQYAQQPAPQAPQPQQGVPIQSQPQPQTEQVVQPQTEQVVQTQTEKPVESKPEPVKKDQKKK